MKGFVFGPPRPPCEPISSFAASFVAAGVMDPALASLAAFLVVGAGGIDCIVAGAVADRVGRTALTMTAMAISGSTAVAIGFLFRCAASAHTRARDRLGRLGGRGFGAILDRHHRTRTTRDGRVRPRAPDANGFLLAGMPILLVGILTAAGGPGWQVAFALLALGPAVGVLAMGRLRRLQEATRMASGRR